MRKIFIILLCIMVPFLLRAQFTYNFGFHGMKLENLYLNSHIGYKFARFVPYVGIEQMSGSLHLLGETTYYGNENDFEVDGSFMVFLPEISIKFLLLEKRTSPFFTFAIYKALGTSNVETDLTNLTPEEEENINEIEDAIGDFTGDLIRGFWGLSFGFGGEYFFNEDISLSCESGIFWERTTSDTELNLEYFSLALESSASLSRSYGRFMLNIYF